MDAQRYVLDVISGRRDDLPSRLTRAGLAAAVPCYRAAVQARNAAFDRRRRTVYRVDVPVISIGNLTTGGTGKTPTAAWIVDQLLRRGRRPGILSRGYRSLDGAENDEKRLLDELCPGVPHVQHRDRVLGGRQAIDAHRCDVLVLDDGFQHRRLHRDLDVVLIDAVNPWGYGRLLPRGLLREPVSSLRRADLIMVTRADQVAPAALSEVLARIGDHTAAAVALSRFAPTGLIDQSGSSIPLSALRDRTVAAFCGIGNPRGFRETLASAGIAVTDSGWRVFPDHYHYSPNDARFLKRWAQANAAEWLVTTRKDLVKVRGFDWGACRVVALDIELLVNDPLPIERRLDRVLHGAVKPRAA